MRGAFADQGGLFSYISPEAAGACEPSAAEGPGACRDVLSELNRSLGRLYATKDGLDPSGAMLERVRYSVLRHSVGTQLMEQLDYNLLYPAGRGLSPDDRLGPTTSPRRDRLQTARCLRSS